MSVLAVPVLTLEPVMTLSTDLIVLVWLASQEIIAKPVNVLNWLYHMFKIIKIIDDLL